MPTSVINGMLASIGLTLMLKQLPLIFGGYGGSATHNVRIQCYMQANGIETTHELHLLVKIWLDTQAGIQSISTAALIIFAVSLLTMLLWEQDFMKKRKFISVFSWLTCCSNNRICFGLLV